MYPCAQQKWSKIPNNQILQISITTMIGRVLAVHCLVWLLLGSSATAYWVFNVQDDNSGSSTCGNITRLVVHRSGVCNIAAVNPTSSVRESEKWSCTSTSDPNMVQSEYYGNQTAAGWDGCDGPVQSVANYTGGKPSCSLSAGANRYHTCRLPVHSNDTLYFERRWYPNITSCQTAGGPDQWTEREFFMSGECVAMGASSYVKYDCNSSHVIRYTGCSSSACNDCTVNASQLFAHTCTAAETRTVSEGCVLLTTLTPPGYPGSPTAAPTPSPTPAPTVSGCDVANFLSTRPSLYLTLGSCSSALPEGQTCQLGCEPGTTLYGSSSITCSSGTLTGSGSCIQTNRGYVKGIFYSSSDCSGDGAVGFTQEIGPCLLQSDSGQYDKYRIGKVSTSIVTDLYVLL